MALSVCRECEGKVSEAATTCPHCGVPNPVMTDTWVTITRKGKFKGGAVAIAVGFDGDVKAIRGDETVRWQTTPGSHVVEMESSGVGGKHFRHDITIQSGETAEFEITFSSWSGVKFSRVR